MAEIMKDLPVEVIKNVSSYLLGEPEYVKIKHSKASKRIQNKYKITKLGPKRTTKRKLKKTTIEYCIMREDIPFSVKSIDGIICEQLEELMYLLYDQVEGCELNAFLTVDTCICAKQPNKTYAENTFDYCNINGTSRIFDRVDEAMDSDLNEIAEEIISQVNHESVEHNIIGIQSFNFKLVIEED